MARIDTLNNFLTDVATAIRTKGGTSEQIQASDFDTAITNLPSGGGGGSEFENEFVEWLEYNKSSGRSTMPLPPNVTAIGSNSFRGLEDLAITSLPPNITVIQEYAFKDCSNLALESLPENLITLGKYAFGGCAKLKISKIPDGVTAIPDYCFATCSNLTKLVMSKNLVSIGQMAFNYCSKILEYDFSNATQIPTLANKNSFNAINAECVIKVPSALYDGWVAATNWTTYADKIVAV